MQQLSETVWTAEGLLERIERSEKFFVFEMLEWGGTDEMVDAVVAFVDGPLASQLPRDVPILAVCANGGTSALVVEGLRRLGYASANLQGGVRAWVGYYWTRAVIETSDLRIHQISRPARGCLSYVVASEGRAVVIDPLRHIDPYLDVARSNGDVIERAIDTHGHADHISGRPALAAATGAS